MGKLVSYSVRSLVLRQSAMGRYSLLLLCTLASTTGCMHRTAHNKFPIVVDKGEIKAIKDTVANYRANPGNVTQETRNNLVERLIGVSDDHYITIKDALLNSRNSVSFVGEVTATTLSAVSAILGDVDTKTILSTASTLTQATKTSLDKNFFSNKSTEALVAKMDALRAERRQTITKGESDGLDVYGLETALNEVRLYDDAGTVESALLSLSAEASAHKGQAEKDLHDLKMQIR